MVDYSVHKLVKIYTNERFSKNFIQSPNTLKNITGIRPTIVLDFNNNNKKIIVILKLSIFLFLSGFIF